MRKNFFFIYGFLLLSGGLAEAQSLTVKKDSIQFTGNACKNLSAENVSLTDGRLIFDLTSMDQASPSASKLTCLIKIPYSDGKGLSTFTLSGAYELNEKDRLTLSIRSDSQGAIAPAKIIDISESPKGSFSYQDSIKFDLPKEEEGLLRISLNANLKSMSFREKKPAESSAHFGFGRLTISDVKDGSVVSE